MRQCKHCGKDFNPSGGAQKYCHPYCRERITLKSGLDTASFGAMGELIVTADLMKRGYSVFRAVSPGCYCDLVARRANVIFEIEVRSNSTRDRNDDPFSGGRIRPHVNCYAMYSARIPDITYLNPKTWEKLEM